MKNEKPILISQPTLPDLDDFVKSFRSYLGEKMVDK